jgi:hypothetical protein
VPVALSGDAGTLIKILVLSEGLFTILDTY